MTTTSPISYQPFQARARLPWGALLALSSAGFLAIFTETMPAGLLPQLASGLGTSPAGAGQLVTLYAVGSLLAAIPLIFATRRMDRKKVLLCAVLGLVLFNTVTALAPWYPLVLLAPVCCWCGSGSHLGRHVRVREKPRYRILAGTCADHRRARPTDRLGARGPIGSLGWINR